jgi:hypothetical protein
VSCCPYRLSQQGTEIASNVTTHASLLRSCRGSSSPTEAIAPVLAPFPTNGLNFRMVTYQNISVYLIATSVVTSLAPSLLRSRLEHPDARACLHCADRADMSFDGSTETDELAMLMSGLPMLPTEYIIMGGTLSGESFEFSSNGYSTWRQLLPSIARIVQAYAQTIVLIHSGPTGGLISLDESLHVAGLWWVEPIQILVKITGLRSWYRELLLRSCWERWCYRALVNPWWELT